MTNKTVIKPKYKHNANEGTQNKQAHTTTKTKRTLEGKYNKGFENNVNKKSSPKGKVTYKSDKRPSEIG